MDLRETLRTGNPLHIVLAGLLALATFLFGLFGKTAETLLAAIEREIPKGALLSGLLLCLGVLALATVALINHPRPRRRRGNRWPHR